MPANDKTKTPIGLAIVGCGRVGRIRGRCALEYPGTEWIGCCDIDEKKGKQLAKDLNADFFTTDYRELLRRSEVNSAVLATDENVHAETLFESIEHGHRIIAEKPLATNVVESAKIVKAAQDENIDIVVGYTQRFRRKWLVAREQVASGQLGDITSATTRAFLNRMVGITRLEANEDRSLLTPMVISGTHALDLILWVLGEGKKPAEIYARSVAKALTGLGTHDSTYSIFTFEDGTLWSMSCSWGLPVVWPASTYSMEIGIVGTGGVLTIDDTHRDMVMATEKPWVAHRGDERHVNFLASYPPGDISRGQFWGPMREETNSWFQRLYVGTDTPHASAEDGHKNLVMTMAMDASSKINEKILIDDNIEDEIVKIQNS